MGPPMHAVVLSSEFLRTLSSSGENSSRDELRLPLMSIPGLDLAKSIRMIRSIWSMMCFCTSFTARNSSMSIVNYSWSNRNDLFVDRNFSFHTVDTKWLIYTYHELNISRPIHERGQLMLDWDEQTKREKFRTHLSTLLPGFADILCHPVNQTRTP